MNYVQQVLRPGECVRLGTTLHWFMYLPSLIALIISLSLGGWYYARLDTAEGQFNFVLLIGTLIALATGLLLAVFAWLKRYGTEIAVTNHRVIYKTGLIRRHTTEIN